MSTNEAALLARKTWRTVEPLHGMIYFVPEAAEAYAALGITGTNGYFASRAAPMGAVSAEVVISTFFNFKPDLVHAAIPGAWEIAAPEDLVRARLRAVDRAYRRLLGDDVVDSDAMARAAELAQTLAEDASTRVEGRPLCAGHARLSWPEEPHLALWHAQSILREFRGDGHIALLVTHDLSGIDALITHGADGEVPLGLLRSTRGWSDQEWAAAVGSLRQRGWLTAGSGDETTFTEWGAAQRAEIEAETDRLAAAPYANLGDEGCAELRSLTRPWSKVVSEVLFR
ncbi:MAG TPA: hypothetical protein VG226_02475 [Acidimicrobiales bacterium]|nr:hypothetical protein [Acidimicrobiales bacterium]